ncbi:DUF6247 family protein [Nonomuraea sp. GTA35]|uniref:DUF6247 family protein n=1 Tax=Nonomuraea sp. GTA35 TaxID=1676746 RepID=UPI0035C02C89
MTAQPHGRHRTPEEIRASIKHDRSPRAIRSALPPDEHDLFDQEYQAALDQARVTYDLAPIQTFISRWWGEAILKADPDEYAETIERAQRAMEYLERGEMPPGARRWDDALDAEMRERIERGK